MATPEVSCDARDLGGEITMTTIDPGIFRQEAIEYRLRNRGRRSTEIAFPRLMAAPIRIGLWVALAILAIGSIVACLPTVPVNAAGLAIITTETWDDTDTPPVAVLIQDDYHDRLEPGRGANVLLGPQERGLRGTIVEVEPQPLAPAEVGERIGLPSSTLSMLNGDVALAWVALDDSGDAASGTYVFGRADLEIGTTPAGSFLPLVGRFFED